MSATRQRRSLRPRLRLDPVAAGAACLVIAAGAAAFATALSPGGYRQGSRLAAAFLLGVAVSLLLLGALRVLLARRFTISKSGALYAAMAGALLLLLAAAGTRILLDRTSGGPHAGGVTSAEQSFRRWTLQAVPLLVRYKDTLTADAAPSIGSSGSARGASSARPRVERARRRLLALEGPVRRLARSTPADLRSFMPLLSTAVRLAVAAQARYEAALAARGERSRALHRQANRLLIRSQQAMAAFSLGVNGVGARLANG